MFTSTANSSQSANMKEVEVRRYILEKPFEGAGKVFRECANMSYALIEMKLLPLGNAAMLCPFYGINSSSLIVVYPHGCEGLEVKR